MAAKIAFLVCASAVLIQSISAQCIGSALAAEELAFAGNAYRTSMGPYGALATGYGLNVAPSSGGGFAVTSTSPISPTGITVISDNAIEGLISVAGELPFLSAVALEGALPTAGAGGINYGCGNGAVAIVSEGITPAYGSMGPAMAPGRYGYAAGFAAPGLAAAGLAAPGCGYAGLGGYGPMF